MRKARDDHDQEWAGEVQPEHEPAPTGAQDIYAWTGMPVGEDRSADYPLSAPCRCGSWLIKPTIHQPWRHRTPADVIDQAADQQDGAVT
jgi:hypothetical protein